MRLEETQVPAVAGEAIAPGDARYDKARRIWNGSVDRHPAAIVRCADTEDVATTIAWARERELPLAVRGGGHSVAGHSVCDGGVVVDLSLLDAVSVDPVRRQVRAGGGTLLGRLDAATQTHGLAVPSGHVSHTGIGGLTLGGGTGWLMRRFGLTIDSLRAATVVTADGEILRASDDEHPDLFWALRGGGGNFGVVTEFEYEAHPLGPLVLGGMLVHPLERAPEVLAYVREFMEAAPRELTLFEVLLVAPPVEPFPPELRGRPVLALGLAWAGAIEDGECALAPLRADHPPVLDLVGPMPYVALQSMIDASVPHGLHHYNTSCYQTALPDEALELLVSRFEHVTTPLAQVLLARMGGAIADVPDDATAFAHRGAHRLLWLVTMWPPEDEPRRAEHVDWTRGLFDALRPWAAPGVYTNALGADEQHRVAAAYAGNWPRLVELKRRYDPENVFRLNQNIRPDDRARRTASRSRPRSCRG